MPVHQDQWQTGKPGYSWQLCCIDILSTLSHSWQNDW